MAALSTRDGLTDDAAPQVPLSVLQVDDFLINFRHPTAGAACSVTETGYPQHRPRMAWI